MKPSDVIQRLAANKLVFQQLLESKSSEEYLFKPNQNGWCLLEVVCHLLDEEVEDFRARVGQILVTPDLPLTPIAPHKWPEERNYLQKDFDYTLHTFLAERQNSVEWLSALKSPDWSQTVDHPEVGPRSAKKFLVNWLAHDYHHIRQINSMNHAFLKNSSGDDLTYAGKW